MSPSRFSQAANGLASYGPYKPVPPPKPFAGNQVIGPHLRQQTTQMEDNVHGLSNGQIAYPHILVTDQGQFVTHSAKFPISEEKDKFSRTYNDKSLSQGIDNPALVTDSSMDLRNHIQHHKEITSSHYAPMRPYDPTKYPHFIPNGHQPPYYRGAFSNASHAHQENNWQNHCPINSNRFSHPSVTESPEKKLFMANAGINQNSQDMTYYQPPCSQQSIAALRGATTTIDHGKNSAPYYPEASASQHDQLLKYDHSGKVSFSLANGMVPGDLNCRNHYTTSTIANGEVNGHSSGTNNEVNGLPQGCDADKKEDKWESLKRASKKCSNFKNIISNKFSKNEPKTSYNGTNTVLSKGTNSQDLATPIIENNTDVLNSERLHNGENHLQENNNFQRVVTYSSLKSRLEEHPQQTYNPPAFFGSERQSGRLPHASSSNIPSSCSYGTQTQPSGILGPPKRAESCTHLGVPVTEPVPKLPQWGIHHRSDDNLTRPLASDQAYPVHISAKVKENASAHFHPGREGRVSGSSDSGRGTGGGSATEFKGHDTSLESGSSTRNPMPGHSSESEWIDIPDSEAKQITFGNILSNSSKYPDGSKTPPLPPLSPEGTPKVGARNSKLKKVIPHRNTKPDIVPTEKGSKKPGNSSGNENTSTNQISTHASRAKSKGWNERSTSTGGTPLIGGDRRIIGPPNRFTEQTRSREKEWRTFDDKGNPFDDDEITSTDAALDLNSVLDGATEITTDDDLASNRDDDAYLIRRQLEGLEGMYSEVLKVLGGGKRNVRAPDPRLLRRRTHGSMSSLPSSVMSNRAIRDKKGKVIDDRLRRTTTNKDVSKSTHRRFQRLESHVVTLARSVAHLSSEMRTQHLMLQEIESIRNDLSALKMNVKPPSLTPARGGVLRGSRLWNGIGAGTPAFSNPGRVKKLTQFFGDEPPLVRIFLKKLGYEKYAPIFEQEKIGMLELPYMTEERLQKIGIPLGPRLRILEESRGPITTDGNLSVYVV